MNSTNWIISPNWLVWSLLGITATSLVSIALRMWLYPIRDNSSVTPKQRKIQSNLLCYRAISWCSFILSLILIILLSFNRVTKEGGVDYSVVVSSLGVLVTLLVAWQIYNSIEAKERITVVENKVQKLLYANLSHVFYVQGESDHKHQNYESALNYYFRGVDCACKGNLENEANQIIKSIVRLLRNAPTVRISIQDSESYCEILSSLNHIQKQEIVDILNTIKDESVPVQETVWDVTKDAKNL